MVYNFESMISELLQNNQAHIDEYFSYYQEQLQKSIKVLKHKYRSNLFLILVDFDICLSFLILYLTSFSKRLIACHFIDVSLLFNSSETDEVMPVKFYHQNLLLLL